MSDQQYDISLDERRLFEIKHKQRTAAKEYFQKLIYNPHRPLTDGVPFDPQLQRFSAMSAYHLDYFKPTTRILANTLSVIGGILLLSYITYNYKMGEEEILRSGVVKYSDRKFKLIF